MNIYALYVGKGNDLGKLFDPILCLLHGLERLAEHIENIRGGGCRDQTFRIGFNGLAERLVGICEKWFSFLDNIQNPTYRLNIECDFIWPETENISKYKADKFYLSNTKETEIDDFFLFGYNIK